MATPIAFESSRVKKVEREQLKDARERVLQEAKSKYERKERQLEEARLRGEDTWMLPSINARLEQEQESTKKHKKNKKDKKKHKEKKKKKKHRRSDSSSSASDSEPVWTESKTVHQQSVTVSAAKGPTLERDSWMTDTPDIFSGVTRQQLKDKKKEDEQAMETEDTNFLDMPGKHHKELNPYWKDGGVGVPEEEKKQQSETFSVEWLRKSYKRCKEMASDQGKSLEEVAAERWGSLKRLENLLKEAEEKASHRGESTRSNSHRNSRDEGSNTRTQRPRSPVYRSKAERERSPKYRSKSDHDKSRSPNSRSRSNRNRSRSPKNRSRSDRDRSRSPSTRQRRSRSPSTRHRRSRSPSSTFSDQRRDQYSHSYDRYKDSLKDSGTTKLKSLSGKFLKPGESNSDSPTGMRKKGFLKPGEGSSSENAPSWKKKVEKKEEVPTWKKKDPSRSREDPSRSHSSSDSSSSSESSDSEEESEKTTPQNIIPVLTEQQMNELGAKIIRAEIMGDQELATNLKSQLDKAREAKLSQPPAKTKETTAKAQPQGEEEDVLLTKTTKSGLVLPIGERQHPNVSGKKRRKQKVATHANDGKRERYFDDDDQYDLKSMVEREKMGTAEDQNMMFARLAGRSVEKTDDEFQIDDVFMNRATKKQSSSIEEERERALAISEHKKKAAALENCRFCFENVPKHLIIAIGVKVYLCLPNHKSLTEGHCLIVPMQHVSSGTTVDEDVWDEIQIYRKILAKMFADREEDCLFMETVMRLKHHPHMCLECVPMPKEVGDLAPIYFKKAIMESETEWAQNKKLVDLSGRDVRKAIPKGFPYFAVDFGTQSGFAHVIEDEQTFPMYFGKEIVGGMLDVDTRLWRKPQKESFEDQRQKVLQFADWWKPYDWTQKLKQGGDSD